MPSAPQVAEWHHDPPAFEIGYRSEAPPGYITSGGMRCRWEVFIKVCVRQGELRAAALEEGRWKL